MELIRAGDIDAAASTLLESNPMPAITGRVCPHYCETDCNRDLFDEAVSVRAVERFLGDHILESDSALLGTRDRRHTGKRVAVVGSGPAGLSAAFYARRDGHEVTVFERSSEPGGMLRWVIPGYRLSSNVVRRVIASYTAIGIDFVTAVEVGKDRSLEGLREEFDVVFLGPGAWGQPVLGLDGEVLLDRGLDFLASIRAGNALTVGRRVLVIGGGNVAVDVALAARRLGADKVMIACLETCDEMPAFSHELQRAREEGVDVLDSCGPTRILADDAGRLIGVQLARCVCVFDEAGRFAPALDDTDQTTISADQVILAIGQSVDLGPLAIQGLALERSRVVADLESGVTSMRGVFAGGDAVTGPASVIAALASGRRAAIAMTRYLEGEESTATTTADGSAIDDSADGRRLRAFSGSCSQPSKQALLAEVAQAQRVIDHEDSPDGLVIDAAESEADRCFNCGCIAVTPSDLAPALVALDAVIVTTRRSILTTDFFAARLGASTVLARDELVTEVRIPAVGETTRGTYMKFRLRGAIDFPVLGLACVLDLDDGVIRKARVVFGAAAPWPVRIELAEAFLQGKALTAQTILEAGRIAVADCLPLAANRYKVQIASGLVAKALSELAQGESVHPETA